jgi:putative redox protein
MLITREAGMALSDEVLADPRAWAAEFAGVETERAVVDLEIPILVVHGTTDDVVPVEHADRIAKNARDAETAIIPGASHRLRHEPAAVDALLAWLERQAS